MTGPDDPPDPAAVMRAAVDVLVFAPLGLGVKLVEDTPAALGKARRELSNARFIGRFAVDKGIAQVRSRLQPEAPSTVTGTREPTVVAAAPSDVVDSATVDRSCDVSADDLALPDYDTLPAIDVVAKLETLGADERLAIERYELANRQRRTVLGKLAQLADR